jgi:endonuclease I
MKKREIYRNRGIFKGFRLLLLPLIASSCLSLESISSVSMIKPASRPSVIDMTRMSDEDSDNYYSSVEGLKGDELVGELYSIIGEHTEYDYDSSSDREIYKIIDRNRSLSPLSEAESAAYDYNDNPYIVKLYADYNDDLEKADRFKNEGASRVSFDKEHIRAQSLGNFGRNSGAGADFFMLRPGDTVGNQSAHSNYNFSEPESAVTSYNNDHGTYVGRNGYIDGYSQKVFEPIDEYKGDIARAMFYMPACYYVWKDVEHPKLQLVNGSPNAVTASASQAGLAGDLATLLNWNEEDPVSEYEKKRADLIYYNYQGNRNPFVDHPEWARIAYDENYVGDGAKLINDGEPSEKTLTSISVDTDSMKTYYTVGESFSLDGLVVDAFYDDGSSETVDDYISSLKDGAKLGEADDIEVTISYSYSGVSKSSSFLIHVKDAQSDGSEEYLIYGLVILGVLILLIVFLTIFIKIRKKRANRR